MLDAFWESCYKQNPAGIQEEVQLLLRVMTLQDVMGLSINADVQL